MEKQLLQYSDDDYHDYHDVDYDNDDNHDADFDESHDNFQDRIMEKQLLQEAEELHLFALDLAIQR